MFVQRTLLLLHVLAVCCWTAAYAVQNLKETDKPIVRTRLGKLRGQVDVSVSGRSYASFLGIPYAKPPLDDLRFAVITLLVLQTLLIKRISFVRI
jgi:hypothetical protein